MMIEHDPDVRAVEAALFAAEHPMTPDQIRAYVGDNVDVASALARLGEHYDGRGVELVQRGKAWHFQTAADLAHLLRREREESRKLSRAAVETLAIIAYHEPVSRAEIEAIRGVQISKGTLDVLMEAGWVRPAGRREVGGNPSQKSRSRRTRRIPHRHMGKSRSRRRLEMGHDARRRNPSHIRDGPALPMGRSGPQGRCGLGRGFSRR